MPNNFDRQCLGNHYAYVIQPNDTLYKIRYRFGVNVSRIIASNPGVDPYHLRIGQTLCIPICLLNRTVRVVRAGDTLYKIAQEFRYYRYFKKPFKL
jgi:LysM repeat protein